MTTSIVVTEATILNPTKGPTLPFAPVQYDRQYADTLNNILRQYFNTLDNYTAQLKLSIGGSGAGVYLPYGSFADTTDQTVAAVDTGTVMTFNTTDFANGVSVVTSGGLASRITVTNPGIYNFQWSGQFQNTDSQDHDASIWVRKNGSDVVGSSGLIAVPSKHGSVDGHIIVGWNFLFNLAANDYIELWWETDNTAVSIQTYPAVTTPPAAVRPSTSSLVATMTFVSAV
jgi:hypothetical protein